MYLVCFVCLYVSIFKMVDYDILDTIATFSQIEFVQWLFEKRLINDEQRYEDMVMYN